MTDDARATSLLARLDAWMGTHPAYPRAVPYFVFVAGLFAINPLRNRWPATYPFTYLLLNVLIVWLLWRYRKLTPELNLKFHWLAVPVGVAVVVVWIALGNWMIELYGDRSATGWNFFDELGAGPLGWSAMIMRLLGMSIVVPLFEELFIRSLLLRSFHRMGQSLRGMGQLMLDMPVIGDMFIHRPWAKRLDMQHVSFRHEFEAAPLGVLSVFAVTISTLLFTFGHRPTDYPGAVVCGVAYCLLLMVTRKKGLGPVIWAHGITNALLWVYTITYNDWRFL